MHSVGRKVLAGFVLVLIALFIAQSVALAQGGSTTIVETVTDSQGASVAHAAITITNGETNSRDHGKLLTGSYGFEFGSGWRLRNNGPGYRLPQS